MAFKPGDKVVRMVGSWQGCVKGTVCTVTHDDGHNNLTVAEFTTVMASDKFVLSGEQEPEAPKFTFKVGDTVVRMVQHINGMFPSITTVYVVEDMKLVDDTGFGNREKIKLQDNIGYWYADKFVACVQAPLPKDFAPGVWVKINKIVHTCGLDGTKKAKWEGAVIQLRKKYEATRWHPEERADLGMSIHNWIDARDCTIVAAPAGAIPAYVPPPPRKVKIYNAERRASV